MINYSKLFVCLLLILIECCIGLIPYVLFALTGNLGWLPLLLITFPGMYMVGFKIAEWIDPIEF
jgi:hypothetical protein